MGKDYPLSFNKCLLFPQHFKHPLFSHAFFIHHHQPVLSGLDVYGQLMEIPGLADEVLVNVPKNRGLGPAVDEFFDAEDAETVATIKDLIETRVRPAVAGDGGDITFRGYKEGIVYLNMKGACSGCPSSTATLRHGIQNLLRHFVPDVVEVRPM